MIKKGFLIGLILLATSLPAAAVEITVAFKQGKPDAKEFVLAAKRAFYRRNYQSTVSADGKVEAVYKGWMKMEMVLGDNGVIIRNTDPANHKEKKVKSYLQNLERDLIYELAEYML